MQNVTFELSEDDARLLHEHLGRLVDRVESELVRTDAPAMQHALARDFERLQAIHREVGERLARARSAA